MRYYLFVLAILSMSGFTAIIVYSQENEYYFVRGKKLIESNCADCSGASKQGLNEGVALVNKAIDTGYKDTLSAYKLLADAYNTLTIVYSETGSSEHKRYSDARRFVYHRLLKLEPKNAQVWYEYAMTLTTTAEQIENLNIAIKIEPKYADAHYAVGMLLIDSGKLEEGIVEIESSLRYGDHNQVEQFANRLIDILYRLGRSEHAERIRIEINKRKSNNR